MAIHLVEVLRLSHEALASRGIAHALIGGVAVIAHGYQRATIDVDLLVDGERRVDARAALLAAGFSVFHESDDTLQLGGPGALDCIFALRPMSRAMLANARPTGLQAIPCVSVEGVIGLKIQAYKNDPKRLYKDLSDITELARKNPGLDRAEVKRYADVFGEWKTIEPILNERSPGR